MHATAGRDPESYSCTLSDSDNPTRNVMFAVAVAELKNVPEQNLAVRIRSSEYCALPSKLVPSFFLSEHESNAT